MKQLVVLVALIASGCAQNRDELRDAQNATEAMLAKELARMDRRIEVRELFERDKQRLAEAIAEFPEARAELAPAYFDESTAVPEPLPKLPQVGRFEGATEDKMRVQIAESQTRILEIRAKFTADVVKYEEQHARILEGLGRAARLRADAGVVSGQ